MAKLTIKQAQFVARYFETGNASEAYRRAYNAARMTDRAIHVEASRLLARVNVSLRIAVLRKKAEERTAVTLERVLREAARIAFADVRRLYGEKGNLKPLHERIVH